MKKDEKAALVRTQKYFAIGDVFVFAAALILIALFVLLALYVPKEQGNSFTVYYDGKAVFTASLSENAVYVFIEERGAVERYEEGAQYSGYNILEVSDGKVRVREADCRSQNCVQHGAADWGEIVCLPHGMRIAVNGEEAQPPVDY